MSQFKISAKKHPMKAAPRFTHRDSPAAPQWPSYTGTS
jgi:hypothetical protein